MFSVRSTSMLPRWHVKDFSQSAKSAGDRVHLNTHTPLTQWSQSGLTMPLSRHSVGTYQENKFAHNSSTNTHRQSSQLAKPLWTDPGLKSAISMRDLISTLKKKKSTSTEWMVEQARNEWMNRHGMNGWTGMGWMVEHSQKILASKEKATTMCSLHDFSHVTCFHIQRHSLQWGNGDHFPLPSLPSFWLTDLDCISWCSQYGTMHRSFHALPIFARTNFTFNLVTHRTH